MSSITGFVDDTSKLAIFELIDAIKVAAEAEGWVVLRHYQGTDFHEVILQGDGFDETSEIFIGFKTYHSVPLDYYNVKVGVFTGFVTENTFETQPGLMIKSVCGHNQRIDYWITLNPRRIAGALKIGTPVYESFYAGGFYAYALPTQYPYPVCCAGTMDGAPAQRFSVTLGGSHQFPWPGNRTQIAIRTNDSWQTPYSNPWQQPSTAGSTRQSRPYNGYYPLLPVTMYIPATGVYGELDGIYQVTGFDNVVENTVNAGQYVIIQNVTGSGFNDYFALDLGV